MDGLRWILAGVGAVILALIYLWGIRARIKEQLRERRRRAARLAEIAPVLEPDQTESESKATELEFGHFGKVSPNHHLADKILVDVEITPVKRAETKPIGKAEPLPKIQEEPESQPEPSRPGSPEEITKKLHEEQEHEPETAEQPQMTVLLTVVAPQGQLFRGSRIVEVAQALDMRLSTAGVFECFSPNKPQTRPVFSVAHLREPGTFDLTTLGNLLTPGLLLFMQLPGPLEAMGAVDFMTTMARRLAQELDGTVCDERRNKMTAQSMSHLRSQVAEYERRLRLQQPHH
jgi:cell division protein ZipA